MENVNLEVLPRAAGGMGGLRDEETAYGEPGGGDWRIWKSGLKPSHGCPVFAVLVAV